MPTLQPPHKSATTPAVKSSSKEITEIKTKTIVDALLTVAGSSKQTRQILSHASVRYFAKYYFGITLGRHQERWILRLLKAKRGLVLAPCGHGKSEIFSKILILWLICRNRNIRILLCSKSDGLAIKNLKAVRYELENNTKLINDYGRFYSPEASSWTDHQLYIIRGKGINLKDPTVEAVGLGGSITGGRFDVIVLDDIVDVLNVREEIQRLKTKDYVEGTLIPRLEPWGVCWGIGTRKHYDDLYADIAKNKTWTMIVDKAIIREPGKWHIEETIEPVTLTDQLGNEFEVYQRVIIEDDDHGEVLWSWKWSMENLLLLRYSIGTVVFTREYQNDITDDENTLFPIAYLEQCRDYELSYFEGKMNATERRNYKFIIQSTDPSLVLDKKQAESTDSDYMIIWTTGICNDNTEVLLGLERHRGLSPKKVEETIESEYRRFDPEYHFLEANAFGTIYAHNLIENRGLRLTKHYTDGSKSDLYKGVPSLSVKFENKKIRLPYKTPEDRKKTDRLIVEFHMLTMEKHDDIVMAGWINDVGIKRIIRGEIRVKRNVNRVLKAERV